MKFNDAEIKQIHKRLQTDGLDISLDDVQSLVGYKPKKKINFGHWAAFFFPILIGLIGLSWVVYMFFHNEPFRNAVFVIVVVGCAVGLFITLIGSLAYLEEKGLPWKRKKSRNII